MGGTQIQRKDPKIKKYQPALGYQMPPEQHWWKKPMQFIRHAHIHLKPAGDVRDVHQSAESKASFSRESESSGGCRGSTCWQQTVPASWRKSQTRRNDPSSSSCPEPAHQLQAALEHGRRLRPETSSRSCRDPGGSTLRALASLYSRRGTDWEKSSGNSHQRQRGEQHWGSRTDTGYRAGREEGLFLLISLFLTCPPFLCVLGFFVCFFLSIARSCLAFVLFFLFISYHGWELQAVQET